ncbi:Ig-like domain-containing protein [Enterobacillus tribolii]|uniref:Bacterial Ig-like domain-containing protein n=1 Tax=Enterobacillus tribolii TaxID=1487935 RepID=A0A370QFH3_9GAMM|nr:Ig-like domain-containing protein [Enterobacillus tribolii]MBW7984149.1 hypothetical protein [Enterobacillus tribolii]RDK86790.1 hypothetical protein C8D90_11064 [Enterobacillus tribolii]
MNKIGTTKTIGRVVIKQVIDYVGVNTTSLERGGETSDTRPTLKGTATAGTKVVIYDFDKVIGETYADAHGNWTFIPKTALSEGSHNFAAQAVDPKNASLYGDRSGAYWVEVDHTVPAPEPFVPVHAVITEVVDDIGAKTGKLSNRDTTDDSRPLIKGTANANMKVVIYDADEVIGETMSDAQGNWSFMPTQDLSTGSHILIAKPVDDSVDMSGYRSMGFWINVEAPELPQAAMDNVISAQETIPVIDVQDVQSGETKSAQTLNVAFDELLSAGESELHFGNDETVTVTIGETAEPVAEAIPSAIGCGIYDQYSVMLLESDMQAAVA